MSRNTFKAAPKFWGNFKRLSPRQKQSVFAAWKVFKVDPFDPRLRTHKINALSAALKRTVYAVEIDGDLRVTFYIDGDTVFTTNVGSHDIYRK